MPLFRFHCSACEADSEILVRNTDSPACPDCGSTAMEKQMAAFAPSVSRRKKVAPVGCSAPSCCQMPGGCSMN